MVVATTEEEVVVVDPKGVEIIGIIEIIESTVKEERTKKTLSSD